MYLSNTISYTIISLGCSKNLVDSERIHGDMENAGFVYAPESEIADIIIINTCGFIQAAKEESIEVIFEALDAAGIRDSITKKKQTQDDTAGHNFRKRVVVLGCLSQRYLMQLKKEIPEIDLIYGLYDEGFICALVKEFNISAHAKGNNVHRKHLIEELSYSYIKISEGCSNNCSYCAIPLIRGPHISYDKNTILEEARKEVNTGARELNIIAQDIASYNWKGARLPELVEEISRIDGLDWIRLLYCHPDHCSDDIIQLIAENEKVVPYIDLPFQHVSKKILLSMGRIGDYNVYSALIDRLRKQVPDIRIRSTFMLGYPGETKGDFELLMRFLEEKRLDRVGAFVYSPEEDTSAALLKDKVTEKTGQQRFGSLMSLQRSISTEKLQAMVNSDVDVLVEEQIDRETYLGRSIYDAPEVDGIFYLTGKNVRVNSIARARVVDSVEYDLIGVSV